MDLQDCYYSVQDDIESRLNEFKTILNDYSDDEIFAELVFCLLTPQSKAQTCWQAVTILIDKDLLTTGTPAQILHVVNKIRFKNNKTRYILKARELFLKDGKLNIKQKIKEFKDVASLRDWLVENVDGMGYKEASHFLRNIGLGDGVAILDRHILKNLKILGLISEIPVSISRKKYLQIEKQMQFFSTETGIPMSHLDLLFWHKETGCIFK